MNGTASWLYLILSVLLNAAASLVLKLSTTLDDSMRLLYQSGSVACYGLAFLCYAACLRSLPVSVAYPVITGGAIVVIVLSAAAFLDEPLTSSKIMGAVLVLCGGILLLRPALR